MSEANAHVPANTPVPTGAVHYSAGQSHPEAPKPPAAHDEHHVHAVSPKILLGVYGALLVLTVATVAATWIDIGDLNIVLALLIAVAKAGLVAMYFMHLRWDSPMNGIVLITAMLFVAIFIAIAVLDTHEYAPDYERPGTGQSMSQGLGARER